MGLNDIFLFLWSTLISFQVIKKNSTDWKVIKTTQLKIQYFKVFKNEGLKLAVLASWGMPMGHFKHSVQWAGRRLHLIWERLELKSLRNKSRRHQALPHPAASNSAEGFRTSFLAIHWLCSGDAPRSLWWWWWSSLPMAPRGPGSSRQLSGLGSLGIRIRVCALLTWRWTVPLLTPPP